jgi:DtxR family Mn-dependent transcriptional regulator
MEFSSQIEDYIKNIYLLQFQHAHVPTTALAERLGVSAPSVTGMIRRLAKLGLLEHERYKGVRLTPDGEMIALHIVRAHRLWELYLVEKMDLSWDQAHVEAERLEHVLSEQLAGQIDQVLGHPTIDPHGHPIPSRDGQVAIIAGIPLTEVPPGEVGVISQIWDDTPELLRYLGKLSLYPGTSITVLQVDPFKGPIHLRVRDDIQVLGHEAAGHIMVKTDGGVDETALTEALI